MKKLFILVNPLFLAIAVAICTHKLQSGTSLPKLLRQFSLFHIFALLWLLVVIWQFWTAHRDKNTIQCFKDRYNIEYANLSRQLMRKFIETLTKAIKYPNMRKKLNIHLFHYDRDEDREYLVKDRDTFIEDENLSRNYTLDRADINSDPLVICTAFREDRLIYQVLPKDHTTQYSENLKGKVDPNIKWILATPLHVPDGKPLGVICCFGSSEFFGKPEDRAYFEALQNDLSDILTKTKLYKV